MGRSVGLVVALSLALLVAPSPGDAALAPPPWEFRVEPPTVVEGGSLVLVLRPRAPRTAPAHDLYVSFIPDGARAWMYLTPDGRWTPTPTPYHRAAPAAPAPPATRFDRVGPSGRYTLRLEAIRPSMPPARRHYAFAPVRVRLRIRAAGPAPWTTQALGGLTAIAVLVVWLAPRLLARGQEAARDDR